MLKTKLINSNIYHRLIILLHFSITYALEAIYVYCSYTVEIPRKGIPLRFSSRSTFSDITLEA